MLLPTSLVSQQAQDDHYGDPEATATGYAAAVDAEVRDLLAAGADVPFAPPGRLAIAPDRGMKYLPRESADGRMRAMAGAAALLRAEREGS